MNEMRNVYEREKLMLMEENKKLQVGVLFEWRFSAWMFLTSWSPLKSLNPRPIKTA